MSYLTKEMTLKAIKKLSEFHEGLEKFYTNHDIDVYEDIGRRNILMSRPQEKFFAEQLSKKYPLAVSDGRTGQADILIPELDLELECKITSPHKSGSWSLQTDYNTLKQKGSLDYLYVLCDREFQKFAVFHFKNLTIEDFRVPSPGSRGKASMLMRNAVKKCNVLMGTIENRNKIMLENIESKLQEEKAKSHRKKLITRKKYWTNTPNSYSYKLESLAF